VTSFLREPEDYALIARDLGEHLLTQNVVYAEVTLSVGVMLLRKQLPEANFEAILRATKPSKAAAYPFAGSSMRRVNSERRCNGSRRVCPGLQFKRNRSVRHGGDELSIPTEAFRPAYEKAAEIGLHRLIHAGEVGGPEKIREAIDLLAPNASATALRQSRIRPDGLARRTPDSTGSLPRQQSENGRLALQCQQEGVRIENHPLPKLLRHGIPVVLSTDDPAMFHTTLLAEYENAARMGLQEGELARIVEMGFQYAFLSAGETQRS